MTLWLILPFFALVIFGIWGYKIISTSPSGIGLGIFGLPSYVSATPTPTSSLSLTGPFSATQSDLPHGNGGALTGTPTRTPTTTRTPTALTTRTKTKTPGPTTIHPPTLTYNPTLANQTITFNALPDKTYGDLPFPVSATATSGLTVSFSTSGTCSNTGSTISITGAGSCTVTASQGGNASYNPAVDVSQSFTVSKANGCSISGWTGTYDGTAHGAGGSCLGTGVLDKGASYSNVSGGPADWSYTGDANYNSQSGSVTITINKADPTFSFDNPGDQYYIDSPFDIIVSATASSGATVTFGTSGSCTNSGSTVTITGTGTCTVTASAGSTSNYNSGFTDRTFNIY